MFTGLIEEVGTVLSIRTNGRYARCRIAARLARRLSLGDSVCVNGACLTAVKKSPFARIVRNPWFEVDMLAVTLEKTALGTIREGSPVNLERAVRADTRMGGHFVTGHVACTGTIESFEQQNENSTLVVRIPAPFMRYMMREGSVALDGISLTIADVKKNTIVCSIIPHTRAATTLASARAGDALNVEPDVLARYVENIAAGKKREKT